MNARFEHIPPGQDDPDPLPGDFILTHGGEFFSRVIQFGQGLRFMGKDQAYTYWNHTALIVSADGALIEALGPGIRRNTLAAYKGTQYTVVHIEASDEDLVNRYEATRRRHPLAPADRVVEGIRKERLMMESLRGDADLIIDTSDLTPHELRERIRGNVECLVFHRFAIDVRRKRECAQ
jgi:hypothetical protein